MTRRDDQAAATRRHILEAARHLFAEQGYRRTTVAQVAAAAGVSVQTIYDSVGSKAALVTGLNDLIRDAAGVPALARGIDDVDDVEGVLAVSAQVTRRILETSGDILRAACSGSDAEPELAGVRDEGTRRHRQAMRLIVDRLTALGVVPPEVDGERLADGFGVLTEAEVWLLLEDRYGWSLDEIETWARTALVATFAALVSEARPV